MEFKTGDFVEFTERGTICRGRVVWVGNILISIEVLAWKPAGQAWRRGDYVRHMTYLEGRAILKQIEGIEA